MKQKQYGKKRGLGGKKVYGVLNGLALTIDLFLKRKANACSRLQLKAMLLSFIVIGGGMSTWILVKSLRHSSYSIKVSKSNWPHKELEVNRFDEKDDEGLASSISAIDSFQRQMDSLRLDPQGQEVYDSLRHARPGLFDSLAKFREMYRLQEAQKK